MENLIHYNSLRRPPESALKLIGAGRLKGKSDINPQWRIEAMTNEFGQCGVGWKYEVTNKWTEKGSDGVVFAFVDVNVYTKTDNEWSCPIPGTGGSMLIQKEKDGFYNNDEAFKMATTDALSVALKAIGVAADIYMGLWDGSKYIALKESTLTELKPGMPAWDKARDYVDEGNDVNDIQKKYYISGDNLKLLLKNKA